MKDTEAITLLKKYRVGTCTEDEKARLESWYLQWNDDEQSFSEEDLAALRDEMWIEMPKVQPKTVRLWPKIAVAVASIAAVVAGIWFFSASRHAGFISTPPNYAGDVQPGKHTATLTLAGGKTITLNEAKTGVVIDVRGLKYNDGEELGISPEKPIKSSFRELMVSTPRGGTYQVTLADGTNVWLNADSKISFPSQFTGLKRKVILNGEAYFEVAKNRQMPFIVESKGQEVEVIGTHFNVNAYQNEGSVKTTLLEGAIRVVTAAHNEVVLKPNQQATLQNKEINVKEVDAELAVSWQKGTFKFEGEEIESIMRKLSRWYNIDVNYEGNLPKERYYGEISRYKNISQVLNMLERTNAIHFKVEGGRVTVMK